MSYAEYCESFEPAEILARCNEFERAICRSVFQDKYSASVKTVYLIGEREARGRELDLMGFSAYRVLLVPCGISAPIMRGSLGDSRGKEGPSSR